VKARDEKRERGNTLRTINRRDGKGIREAHKGAKIQNGYKKEKRKGLSSVLSLK
jgi:hypothetical protein